MRAKETLQLRHQLSASGLSLRAAAYDTKRHHVLSFDSHALRPHVLRLFSLRRELKSVSLLDQEDEESGSKQAVPSSVSPFRGPQGRNRPSFLDMQQQKHNNEAKTEVVVPTVLLQYSPLLDVFLCVYSKATRAKGSTKVPKITAHYVLLLEPATLRKLLVYQGPETHLLQCAHYDPITDRLVLASHLKSDGNGADRDGMMFPSAPKNVVEILQLSKRPEDSQGLSRGQEPVMLLLIGNTRASLRHPDTMAIICGSRGLKALYGAASDGNSTDTTLLEWRHNQLKFVLVRRVMLRHQITTMAVSPCGDWLLAGSSQGGLRVWNINGSRTNASGLFTIDAEPFEPSGSSVADAQTQVISSIEATTTPMPDSTDKAVALADVIVIAAERDTGVVRHWRFSVERKKFESDTDASSLAEHRYPRLSLVGCFDTGGKEPLGKGESRGKFKHQDTLGPPLKTLIMCVTIDMGSCFENLLLVVREDVIHVLKVQTVLYVMQKFPSIEQAYAVRAFEHQEFCQVISLSSTAACKLRLFPLDENSHQSSSKLLFVSAQASENSHVCAMETITSSSMQLPFVVLAWSNGVVDIYDILREKHVMKLQDKHLTDQISTLSVVQYHRVVKHKERSLPDDVDKGGLWSSRSDENPTTIDAIDEPDEAVERRIVIIVGTERGELFGWKTDALWGDSIVVQNIPKANVRVQAAHSSHIIQLARVDAVDHGERPLLASVGVGGIIKFWRVPSLKVVSYINSVADGYPASPSSIELLKGVGTGNEKATDFVAVGYEDGRMAVWKINFKRVSFLRLDVSTKHERCVSKICRVSSDVVSSGLVELLSCSLDMTVIQWEILESGTIHEKRYFDIGSAIVDMVLVKEQAVVALAHEVCKFVFAPSSKCDVKYLMKPEAEANSDTEKQQKPSGDADDAVLPRDDDYPNTPTTRSLEDATEAAPPTQRTVEEYLTLHVPSAVLHLEASSLTAGTGTDSRDQHEGAFNLGIEAADKMSRYTKAGKSTGQLPDALITDDTLRDYLQEYIARHGTGGTMAASRITHLMALRPELPNIKRPGFALARSLKDLKLTAQARVDTEDALQILKLLFAVSKIPSSSFDAPTMARSLKLKDNTNQQAHAQRLREKKQARRKPVVTYNVLGEKYVRWEEGPPEREKIKRNQAPSSPISNLTIHTPTSPNRSAFGDNFTPERSGFVESETQRAPNSTVNDDKDLGTASPRVSSIEDAEEESGEESEEEEDDVAEGDEEEEDEEGEDEGNENDDGNGDLSKYKEDSATLNEATAAPAPAPAKKMPRVKRIRRNATSNGNISSDALVNSIRLSPMFQPFWTKGYCWCSPAPPLNIVWTDDNNANGTKVRSKCEVCHKRQHTVDLPRVGYAPHFSRQSTFDIIVEVYSKLTATAHSNLYKNTRPQKEECSIFSALFEVFLTTYGMRSTVELKLKLFFVSMCHLLPEYDAVAVFGELLGLHKSNVANEYDHAPATLVALCVCCYSWLYSRGMVVNGDSFSGRLRGSEWNSYRSATEVVPATDGTSHWQFVRIEHALLCAQDNLLYPLVSPGFLRNIMLFMQDYGQGAPSRSLRTDSPDFGTESASADWIEIHRFLRLLVGEWKHQNAEFRVVERLLFIHPQRDAAVEGELLEKLRLLLSCFIFYDHERVGMMAINDFEALLYKLRYLWPVVDPADLPVGDNALEKAIVAIKKRFLDLNHDGLLCYLDFWAMLYIVGVKTHGLIRFHELPSFCRDYRLEMSAELCGMVLNYMQLSCTLLLPKGLQVGKSSMDQKAERQHRRRVGGLHDGTFHFSKTLKGSLSTQELLGTDDTQRHGLYLDGSVPAIRQTASTTALDRFRPVSVEDELHSGSSSRQGCEPVVAGIRPTGPTPKRAAPLSVSLMGNFEPGNVIKANYAGVSSESVRRMNGRPKEQPQGYTNMYIQFPQVAPVRKHVKPNDRIQVIQGDTSTEDEATAIYDNAAIEEEPEHVEVPPVLNTASTRPLSSKNTVSIPEPIRIIHEEPIEEEHRPRSATKVVVVPTAETKTPISSAGSRSPLITRESSRTLLRVVSDRLQLEETVVQLEAEMEEEQVPSPRQPTPVPTPPTPREDPSENDVQSVVPIENNSEVEANDVEQPVEHVEDIQEESVTTVDVPAEPEPVEVSSEPVEQPVEPIAVPVTEELVVENVVEPPVEDEEPPGQVAVADVVEVDEPLVEQVISTPTPPLSPVAEPDPVEIPITEVDTTSDVASEEVLPDPEVSSYQPQVLKQDEIQIHHTFRFSQQPTFLRGVVVTNNPYRTAMWNPDDDSESDDSETGKISLSKSTGSKAVEVDSVNSSNPKEDSEATPVSHLSPSPSTLAKQSSSRDLIQLSKLQSRRSNDLEAIRDEGDDDQSLISDAPMLPFRRKRLDEAAERALYGERIVNVLGEGIAFSVEAEAAMQHKWQQFFDDSEEKMFSAMRNDLEKKQTEQREAEERQNKLRKKWQEQRDQDLLRLQHSRQNRTLLVDSKQNDGDNETSADASFRLRRIHRESCRQLTEELQFGVSVQRGLEDTQTTQFFHFYYLPEGHGSIITLKMHVLKGDAEVFMSTDTKVPCSTDFMWRSTERLAKDTREGHRIILYPHDLLKVAANAGKTSLRIGFYLSVVALEPGTSFTLAVMSSGQKMQPSRAIQTVDYLIDRFNMLSRSFEDQSNAPFDSQAAVSRRHAVVRRQSFGGDEDDTDGDEEGDNFDDTATELTEISSRRKTKRADVVDPQELKSFQYLLETLSERKGFGSPRAASILLAGPSEDHLEFVQDEDQRLEEMHRRLSPPKRMEEFPDPVAVVTERRLTLQGKRQKLRRVVAARLQQKLAPLRHKSVGELEKSASTGTLGNIRPVAYSISTLDPLPRSQRFKPTIAPLVRAKSSTVVDN